MDKTSDSDRRKDDRDNSGNTGNYGDRRKDDRSTDSSNSRSNHQSNASPQESRSSRSGRYLSRPQWRLPNVKLPNVRLPKVHFPRPRFVRQPYDWLGLVLFMILSSYACAGYFLSILLTIPARQNLAIAGFGIMGLLPILTAFADYGLMKWGYLISGFLIVGGLYMAKLSFHYMFLAVMVWLGITAIAFVGEFLLNKQKRKLVITILILWLPCVLGLALGWQIWHLVATNLS